MKRHGIGWANRLKKTDNIYKKTAIIFNFEIFWPKYANFRHFSQLVDN